MSIGLGSSRYTESQQAAPAIIGTHVGDAPPLARNTMNKAEPAPTQIGRSNRAMTVLSPFGPRQVFETPPTRASRIKLYGVPRLCGSFQSFPFSHRHYPCR